MRSPDFERFEAAAFVGRRNSRSVVLSGESAGAACSVRLTVKVDPAPCRLSTVMSPFISCASRRTIERPSPVPPKRRVVEESACANGWNRRARCSSESPMPVSLTAIVTFVIPWPSGSVPACSVIRPRSVNLIALPSRLNSTCRTFLLGRIARAFGGFLGSGERCLAALERGDVAIKAEHAAVAQRAEIEFDELSGCGPLLITRAARPEHAARHFRHGAFDILG